MAGSPVLPLRPLTVSELLDAAAALLRSRWRVLLAMSFGAALIEQVILTTLHMTTQETVRPKYFGDFVDNEFVAWSWVSLGLMTETVILVLLAGPAARTAASLIRDEDPSRLSFATLSKAMWARVVALGGVISAMGLLVVVLTLCAAPTLSVPLLGLLVLAMACVPWLLFMGTFALTTPIAVVDGVTPGHALKRTFTMLRRSHGRTLSVMVLAMLSWSLIRFVITIAALMVVWNGYFDFATIPFEFFFVMLGISYLAINTAAYALLACLAAVLHIETRIRTEGLDIVIARMRARGEPVTLNVPEAR